MATVETLNNNNKQEEEGTVVSTKVADEIGIEEYLLKHPLQNTWTLWFYDHGLSKVWEENQREIISFDSIEDFWSLFNHIKVASELRQGCDYSLFKKGIRPMWEDTVNRQGGRWLISLDKKQRNDELDKYWLEVVLLLIGEGFDAHSEEICGAVINIRARGDKIGIWTKDAQRNAAIMDIGRKVKSQLQIPQNLQIKYESHKDASAKTGSTLKNLFTL